MYLTQRALLYPGATGADMPTAPPWGEWATIRTPDGETLAALHSLPAAGKPTFLLFHGNADTIVRYGFLAEAFAKYGLGLLAISYRGYPGSTGAPSETGLLIDGLAAFDWLEARGDGRIVLLGRSLGTGVAVNTAVERQAAALVLVSAYDSMAATAQRHYPFLPVGLLIKDSFRSDLRIAGVTEPKLFVHGDIDELIPLSSGQALFAQALEPKFFRSQQGLAHNNIWSPGSIESIVAFIDTVAPLTQP